MTSTLAFDIAQFFPSINYCMLLLIFGKAGFDSKVMHFFSNYLVGRKTQYFWNNFSSSFFNVDVGVEQDSALFSILSALYLAPILYILEKHLKTLKICQHIDYYAYKAISTVKCMKILRNSVWGLMFYQK